MYIESFTKNTDEAVNVIRKRVGEIAISNLLAGLIKLGLLVGGGTILIVLIAVSVALVPTASFGPALGVIIGILAMLLLWLTLSDMISGSIIKLTFAFYQGQKMEGTQAVSSSFKKFFVYMGFNCIRLLIMVPFVVGITLIFFLVGSGMKGIFDVAQWKDGGLGAILLLLTIILIGVVLIILLYFVYKTFFIFGVAAIMIDNLGPIQAFKKNLSLIRGEFIAMMKKVILYDLGVAGIQYSFMLLITTIIGIVALVMNATYTSVDWIRLQYIGAVLEWPARIFSTLVISALIPAVTTFLYISQKSKKEGEDIRRALHQLRQSQTNKEIVR